MNAPHTITADPLLLVEARGYLTGLRAVATSDNAFKYRARQLAEKLADVISISEEYEMPILRGRCPHLSALNYWLADYREAIEFVLRDEPMARAAESYIPQVQP